MRCQCQLLTEPFGQVHEILVLISEVTDEGLDEPVLVCSLAKAFPDCTHKVGIWMKAWAKFQAFSLSR